MSKHLSFDALLKHIASDSKFRVELLKHPQQALRGIGVDPTPQMIASLKGLDFKSLEAVAEAFPSGEVRADTAGFC